MAFRASAAAPTRSSSGSSTLRAAASSRPISHQRLRLVVVANFSFGQVLRPSPEQEAAQAAAAEALAASQQYEALLAKADERTFHAPAGQLHGRQGRRCTLEDGERMLERAIELKPDDERAHLLLLRNIMSQALGRQRDVPRLAIRAIEVAAATLDADLPSPATVTVLQATLLGCKALHSLGRADDVPFFVADARAAAPSMAGDIDAIAERLARQLRCRGADGAAVLLARRAWLASIDLSFVADAPPPPEPGADGGDGGGGAPAVAVLLEEDNECSII